MYNYKQFTMIQVKIYNYEQLTIINNYVNATISHSIKHWQGWYPQDAN